MKKCKTCGTLYDGFACPVCHPELIKQPADDTESKTNVSTANVTPETTSEATAEDISSLRAELQRMKEEKQKAELEAVKLELERLKSENRSLQVERDKAVLDSVKAEKSALEREVELLKVQTQTVASGSNYRKTQNVNGDVSVGATKSVMQKLSAILPSCIFLFFALLNLIFFCAPVSTLLGEGVASFWECLNEENFILFPNPLSGATGVLVLEIIAVVFGLAYVFFALYPSFKDALVKIGGKKFSLNDLLNVVSLLFTLTFVIVSAVCMGKAKNEVYQTGSCFVLILVFAIVFMLTNAVFLIYRLYLHKNGKIILVENAVINSDETADKSETATDKKVKLNKSELSFTRLVTGTKIAKVLKLLTYALTLAFVIMFFAMFEKHIKNSELSILYGFFDIVAIHCFIKAIVTLKNFSKLDYYKQKTKKSKHSEIVKVKPKYKGTRFVWFVILSLIAFTLFTLWSDMFGNGGSGTTNEFTPFYHLSYSTEKALAFKNVIVMYAVYVCLLCTGIVSSVMLKKYRKLFIIKTPKTDENGKKIKSNGKWQLIMSDLQFQENLTKERALIKAYNDSVAQNDFSGYETAKAEFKASPSKKLKLVSKRFTFIGICLTVIVTVLVSVICNSSVNTRLNVFSVEKVSNYAIEGFGSYSAFFGEDYEKEGDVVVYSNQALKDYNKELESYQKKLILPDSYDTVLTYQEKIRDLQENSGEMGLQKLTLNYDGSTLYKITYDAKYSEASLVPEKEIKKVVYPQDNRVNSLHSSVKAEIGVFYTDGSYAWYKVEDMPAYNSDNSKYYLEWVDEWSKEDCKWEVVEDNRKTLQEIWRNIEVTYNGQSYSIEVSTEAFNNILLFAIEEKLPDWYYNVDFGNGNNDEIIFGTNGKIKVCYHAEIGSLNNERYYAYAVFNGDTTKFKDLYEFCYDTKADDNVNVNNTSTNSYLQDILKQLGFDSMSDKVDTSKEKKVKEKLKEYKQKVFDSLVEFDDFAFDTVLEPAEEVDCNYLFATVFKDIYLNGNFKQSVENVLKKSIPSGIFSDIDVRVYSNYLKVYFDCALVQGQPTERVTGYYYGSVDKLLPFVQLSKSAVNSLEADLSKLLDVTNTDVWTVPFANGSETYNNVKKYLEEKLASYNQSRTAFEQITLTYFEYGR